MHATADDLQFFKAHGWVVLRRAVQGELLASIQRAHEALLTDKADALQPAGGDHVWQLTSACRMDSTLNSYLFDAGLGGAARTLIGCERVRLLQDLSLRKEAKVGGTVGWHRDNDYLGFLTPPGTASLRLALSDESDDSGAMIVLDGSHLWPTSPEQHGRDWIDQGALTSLPPGIRTKADAAWRRVDLAAGDISVHHCLTWHASGRNQSPRERDTLITHVFDADCLLDRERLPHPDLTSFFETDARGRVVGDLCPLL